MAYTPELSYGNSCTLRRIAWSLNLPMTQAINKMVEDFVKHLDRDKICSTCKDKSKCKECSFNHKD